MIHLSDFIDWRNQLQTSRSTQSSFLQLRQHFFKLWMMMKLGVGALSRLPIVSYRHSDNFAPRSSQSHIFISAWVVMEDKLGIFPHLQCAHRFRYCNLAGSLRGSHLAVHWQRWSCVSFKYIPLQYLLSHRVSHVRKCLEKIITL